ncbi:MAG: 50S ribosomal protein L6 [Spirochaetales bacterium]|nr:50S ribosomal protein L6 [Spirochaetales bacterium]
MSRIGKLPVALASGVKINIDKNTVQVEGPKGKLAMDFSNDVKISVEENQVVVTRKDDSKRSRAMHGLYRNLLNNMMIGVSEGFKKVLVINGIGYRAEKKGDSLILNLGYSNPIEYPVPEGITIEVEANNKIVISGNNKQQLGQVCAEIRGFRPPEPYKGKGVRYENEYVRKKVGKTGVK